MSPPRGRESPSQTRRSQAPGRSSMNFLTMTLAAALLFLTRIFYNLNDIHSSLAGLDEEPSSLGWPGALPEGRRGPTRVSLPQLSTPSGTSGRALGGGQPRTVADKRAQSPEYEYVAFIGVFTSVNPAYIPRRQTLRQSWFPSTKADLEAFEAQHNSKLRFVMGKPSDGQVPEEIRKEEEEFGGHIHIDVVEEYDNLKLKMLKYFRDTISIYRAQYYLKVDDDIFFRPDRIPLAVPQWRAHNADYVGCFRKGSEMFSEPDHRYFEHQRFLTYGEKYFMYAAGPSMALSAESVMLLASIPERGLRFFGAGDASVGGWMLSLNVSHYEDQRLCHTDCQLNTIGYYDVTSCNGLCKPLDRPLELMKEQCGNEAAIPSGHAELPESDVRPFDTSHERCATLHEDWLDQRECRRM